MEELDNYGEHHSMRFCCRTIQTNVSRYHGGTAKRYESNLRQVDLKVAPWEDDNVENEI